MEGLPVNVSACDLLSLLPPTVTETKQVVHLTAEEQTKILLKKELQCYCRIQSEPARLTGLFCERLWDNVMCWDDTPAGTTAQQPCPSYINSFTTRNSATRTCLSNGTWFVNPEHGNNDSHQSGWSNYTACYTDVTLPPDPRLYPSYNVPDLFIKHIHEFRIMYNVGYALSLITLIFAFIIMTYFRKLHCSRNTIHLNLFAAFICRAGMSLLRDNLMVNGIGFPHDVAYNDTGGVFFFTRGPHLECRLFFSVFQYALTASYFWIFVEAVYLHVLIFVTVLSRKVKIFWYILLGWGSPLIIVIVWSLSRYFFNNTLCWNLNINKPGIIWIINAPIMVTILINSIFFVRLVRVLYTKLRASPCPEGKRHKYRRLARSTMFLIPVFGVHYIIFAVPTHGLNDTVAFVMLFIEMFFNSYQGFFIALVLCFINGEVRTEVTKTWRRRSLRRGSEAVSKMKYTKSQQDRIGAFDRNGTLNSLRADQELLQLDGEVTQGLSRQNSEELPFLKETALVTVKSNNFERQNQNSSECCTLETEIDTNKLEEDDQGKSEQLLSKNNNVFETNVDLEKCNTSLPAESDGIIKLEEGNHLTFSGSSNGEIYSVNHPEYLGQSQY